MSDPIVRMQHVRQAQMCARGARAWILQHGLDWNVFLGAGYPASVIEAQGDELGRRVAAVARREAADAEQGQ